MSSLQLSLNKISCPFVCTWYICQVSVTLAHFHWPHLPHSELDLGLDFSSGFFQEFCYTDVICHKDANFLVTISMSFSNTHSHCTFCQWTLILWLNFTFIDIIEQEWKPRLSLHSSWFSLASFFVPCIHVVISCSHQKPDIVSEGNYQFLYDVICFSLYSKSSVSLLS